MTTKAAEVRSGLPAVRDERQNGAMQATDGGSASIQQLLHFAIEKGAGVEQLEKLVALHERMQDRQAALEFAQAMAAFQAECPPIRKSSTAKITTRGGSGYSYTYAELDEIATTINPILFQHGLSYSWDSAVDKGQLTCVCIVRHVNGHSTRTTFSLPIDNESAMSAQQKVAAALTFAKRQSLVAALGIVTTDEDTDGARREVDATPIDEKQRTQLEEMIDAAEIDYGRFLKFLGVEKLSDLPRVRFDEAKAAIAEKKRRKEAR